MDQKIKEITLKKLTESNIRTWEQILKRVLTYRSRKYSCEPGKDLYTIRNKCKAFEQFEYLYGYLAKERLLVGRFTKDVKDIEITQELLKDISKYVKNPQICDLTIAEILTKVLAYRNLRHKMRIEIPTLKDNEIKLKTYEIDEVFDLYNSMKAFGLKSLDGKSAPLLLFRGTDFSITEEGRTSIMSNFDPEGPGHAIYHNARPRLRNWLKAVCKGGLKARALGFSLGGALASYSLIFDPEFFSQSIECSSYTFNHPGVDDILMHKWKALPKNARPALQGFIAEGDFVSKYGKLFSESYQMKLEKNLEPIESHTSLYFTKPLIHLSEINVVNENKTESRKKYSKLHQKTSKILFHLGLKYLLPDPPKQ